MDTSGGAGYSGRGSRVLSPAQEARMSNLKEGADLEGGNPRSFAIAASIFRHNLEKGDSPALCYRGMIRCGLERGELDLAWRSLSDMAFFYRHGHQRPLKDSIVPIKWHEGS